MKHPPIQTFAVAKPASGPAGLLTTHLDCGELLKAVWSEGKGLELHGQHGSRLIEMSPAVFDQNWSTESTIQVLETDDDRNDQCCLIPLELDLEEVYVNN